MGDLSETFLNAEYQDTNEFFEAAASGRMEGAVMSGDSVGHSRFYRGRQATVEALRGKPIPAQTPIKLINIPALNLASWPEGSLEQEYSHPVCIMPCPVGTSVGPRCDNFIFALNANVIDPGSGRYTPTIWTPAYQSINGGALYLPAGRWYLYYPDQVELQALVLDARDPMLAAMILSRPGNHSTSYHPNEISVPPAASTTVIPGRINRKAIFLQNVSDYPVRITFGTAVNVNRGVRLPAQMTAPLVLAGPTLTLDDIYAISENGVDTATVTVTELV